MMMMMCKKLCVCHSQDENGTTALLMACNGGHVEAARALLSAGASPKLLHSTGLSPLHHAVNNEYGEVVHALLAGGPPVDAPFLDAPGGDTALFRACERGYLEAACSLLAYQAKVDFQDVVGATSLSAASRAGHVEVVRLLLSKGATVDLQNRGGESPLYAACCEGHVEVVRELLAAGAQVDLASKEGESPLYVACSRGHVEVACALLAAGAQVDLASRDGVSPLYAACSKGHVEVVRALLAAGAQVSALFIGRFHNIQTRCKAFWMFQNVTGKF